MIQVNTENIFWYKFAITIIKELPEICSHDKWYKLLLLTLCKMLIYPTLKYSII